MAAADRGELEPAIAALEASFRLFPHPGTLLDLALYRDRDDRSVAAYDSFNQLLDRYGTVISAATRELVEARLGELEGRLAAVTIETYSRLRQRHVSRERLRRAVYAERRLLGYADLPDTDLRHRARGLPLLLRRKPVLRLLRELSDRPGLHEDCTSGFCDGDRLVCTL